MDYLMLALSELGIEVEETEMPAMTYLCYMTREPKKRATIAALFF